jgi:hypothetical protein
LTSICGDVLRSLIQSSTSGQSTRSGAGAATERAAGFSQRDAFDLAPPDASRVAIAGWSLGPSAAISWIAQALGVSVNAQPNRAPDMSIAAPHWGHRRGAGLGGGEDGRGGDVAGGGRRGRVEAGQASFGISANYDPLDGVDLNETGDAGGTGDAGSGVGEGVLAWLRGEDRYVALAARYKPVRGGLLELRPPRSGEEHPMLKSMSFTSPVLVTRTFDDLRSRWNTPRQWSSSAGCSDG